MIILSLINQLPLKLNFFSQLILSTCVSILVAFIFHKWLLEVDHIAFLLVSIGFFTFLAAVVHQLAFQATKSNNKYTFSRLTMGVTFFKMLLVVLLVAIYRLKFSTDNIDFIWPFLLIYLIFTILETRFLLKLAKA